MKVKLNQAGRWERINRSIYQKVDLHMEARKARKACRKQLGTINGGLNGDMALFRSQVVPFWKNIGSSRRKCGMTFMVIKMVSMIRATYQKIYIGRKYIQQ